jgi:hypothetical protein
MHVNPMQSHSLYTIFNAFLSNWFAFFHHTFFHGVWPEQNFRSVLKSHCLGNMQIENSHYFLLSRNSHQIFFSLYKKYKLNIFGLKNCAPSFLQSSKSAVLQFSWKCTFFVTLKIKICLESSNKNYLSQFQVMFYLNKSIISWIK